MATNSPWLGWVLNFQCPWKFESKFCLGGGGGGGGRGERRWVKRWGTHQGNSAGRVLRPRCMQFVGRWLPGATGKSPRFATIDLEEWQKSKQSPTILHAKNNGFGKCEERTDWISRNASWMDLSFLLAPSYCWLNHMKEKKIEKNSVWIALQP